MLSRLTVSLTLALLAVYGSTSAAHAGLLDDRQDVELVTAAIAAVLMVVLLIAYLIRHALGADKMAPPEPEPDAAAHH